MHQGDNRYFGLNERHTYTTESGRVYVFARNGVLGRKLQFTTPVRFTHDQWQVAIDRGLGTHATSILTRTRAQLGSYISMVEQAHLRVSLAPKAQANKCALIMKAQKTLKKLESEEQNIDPANIQNGPLQEQLFKAKVQEILFNLRKDLVAVDSKFGSAMLGEADQIVAQSINAVDQFHWPYEANSTDDVEKNTRRRKITANDQLRSTTDSIYHAKYEFPDGLESGSRDRLLNALRFNDPDLTLSTQNFLSIRTELGESRGIVIRFIQLILTPLAFLLAPIIVLTNKALAAMQTPIGKKKGLFARLIDAIKAGPVGIVLNLLLNEPYKMLPDLLKWFEKTPKKQKTELLPQSRQQKLIEETHARCFATKIAANSLVHHSDLFSLAKKTAKGDELLEKRILYQLFRLNMIPKNKEQELAKAITPLYSIDDLLHPSITPLLIPTSAQGDLFARYGATGSLYNVLDPIFRGIEEEGRINPISGSIWMLLWGLSGTTLLGTSLLMGNQQVLGMAVMHVLKLITDIPLLAPSLPSFVTGPLGITSVPNTAVSIIAKMITTSATTEHHTDPAIRKLVQTLSLKEERIQKELEELNEQTTKELISLRSLIQRDRSFINAIDLKALIELTPPQSESIDFEQFLLNRYPDIIAAYGGEKENDPVWNNGLLQVLNASYFNDLLSLRQSNPNAWLILKQYDHLIQRLSGQSVEHISKIDNISIQSSRWASSPLFAPFRAIHGLVGGLLVGLPAYAYYFFTNKPFPARFRQYSGYNNLLGIIEGLPLLTSVLTRTLITTNEMFVHAKARIYDKATNFPKNVKSIPGFIVSLILAIPLILVDALISIPSLLWNAGVALGRYLMGKKQRLSPKEYLYKLPFVGFIAEAINEPSFEERATRRIIQTNQDKHEIFGTARALTTARAGDLSSYRKSHHIQSLLTPTDQFIDVKINVNELQQTVQEYKSRKSILSPESYIMSRLGVFVKKQIDQSYSEIQGIRLLQFLFPEEYNQLRKRFKIEHAKEYIDLKKTKDLNKLCKQAIYASLLKLFKEELAASKGSITHDVITHASSTAELLKTLGQSNHEPVTEDTTNPVTSQALFREAPDPRDKQAHVHKSP